MDSIECKEHSMCVLNCNTTGLYYHYALEEFCIGQETNQGLHGGHKWEKSLTLKRFLL